MEPKFLFTSFHPSFSFEEKVDYKNKQFCKSLEGSYLWYLYVRNFLPKNYHIFIIDQNSDYEISYLLDRVGEEYEILDDSGYNFNPNVFLHIKKFKDKASKTAGVKRLYFWIYEFCLTNKTNMFFLEQDCFLAKDLSKEIDECDFITNSFYLRERVCDTYLCNISSKRFLEKENIFSMEDYIKNLKKNDLYKGDEWHKDVVCMILCERGMYALFCYGNIYALNNQYNIHNCSNQDFLFFLKKYPIEHSFYISFVKKLEVSI